MCLASSLLSVSSSGRWRTTFRRQSTFHCVVICITVLICVLSLWNDRGWQCCHSNSASYDRSVWSYLLSLASIRASRAVYMGSLRCFLLIFRVCFCSIAICNLEWVWYTWRDHFRSAFMFCWHSYLSCQHSSSLLSSLFPFISVRWNTASLWVIAGI